MANKIDSNVTGLRYAEETSLGVVSGSATWYLLEPNKYNDFGGKLTTVARNPINATRQRKKGTVTDLEASGGFNQDLTQSNTTRMLQGFMFADIREKATTQPMNSAALALTATTTTTYTAASGLSIFKANDLVLASGFNTSGNNGLKLLSAAAAGSVTTTGLAVETPPAAAKLEAVGYEFAVATLDVTLVGGMPRLNRASGAFDFTTLGLIPGEWIFIGGDVAANQFANNLGYARVSAVAAAYIDLDKTDFTPQAETGTGKNIRIFFGSVLKNESAAALIKRRSYQLERTLGADANGTMSEYIVGAVANELSFNVKQGDKLTVDLSFVGIDVEQRTGLQAVKAGTRPTLTAADAFNAASDVTRVRMSTISTSNSYPTPLFAFITEATINVKNNVSGVKAIGALAAVDTTAGMFEVGGKVTAYFADVAAVQAVRNNADVTLDMVFYKNNAGMVVDIPLLALGDGRLSVEQDKAIDIPLDVNAVASKFDHTLLVGVFPYLPTAAA